MKIISRGEIHLTPREFIRKCGYGEHYDRQAGKISYSRHLSGTARYPRFHAYLTDYEKGFEIDLHLDQKAPVYAGAPHAHNAEYDGEVVEREVSRINELLKRYGAAEDKKSDKLRAPKKGLWQSIFGRDNDHDFKI